MYKFVIGTSGLNTSIDEIMTEEAFWDSEPPPNTQWQHVTVASKEDANKWIDAKNAWLSAAWEPNQSYEQMSENRKIMRQAEETMISLEIQG